MLAAACWFPQACAVTNTSRAFWRADVQREGLQRVYAITFPDNKQLKEYQYRMEEVGCMKVALCGGRGDA